jgi:hypothetical protein
MHSAALKQPYLKRLSELVAGGFGVDNPLALPSHQLGLHMTNETTKIDGCFHLCSVPDDADYKVSFLYGMPVAVNPNKPPIVWTGRQWEELEITKIK